MTATAPVTDGMASSLPEGSLPSGTHQISAFDATNHMDLLGYQGSSDGQALFSQLQQMQAPYYGGQQSSFVDPSEIHSSANVDNESAADNSRQRGKRSTTARGQHLESFARLKFPDGTFHMTTYSLIIGRDQLAIDQAKRDQRDGEQGQGQGDNTYFREFPRPGHQRPKFSRSYVSEEGGIMGPEADPDELSARPAKRRKTRSRESGSQAQSDDANGGQAGHQNGEPSSAQEQQPQPQPRNVSDRQYVSQHTPDSAMVDIESHRPSPHTVPFVGIHSPGPDMIAKTKAISRNHLKISFNFQKGVFEAIPLHRNGFFHNEVHITKDSVVLRSEDKLQIKDILFSFVINKVDPGCTGAEPDGGKKGHVKSVGGKEMSFDFEDTDGDARNARDTSEEDDGTTDALQKLASEVADAGAGVGPASTAASAQDRATKLAKLKAENHDISLDELPMVEQDAIASVVLDPEFAGQPRKRGPGRPPKNGLFSLRQMKERLEDPKLPPEQRELLEKQYHQLKQKKKQKQDPAQQRDRAEQKGQPEQAAQAAQAGQPQAQQQPPMAMPVPIAASGALAEGGEDRSLLEENAVVERLLAQLGEGAQHMQDVGADGGVAGVAPAATNLPAGAPVSNGNMLPEYITAGGSDVAGALTGVAGAAGVGADGTPTKRKVGRPRKHPLPENADERTERRKYKPRKPKTGDEEGGSDNPDRADNPRRAEKRKTPPLQLSREDYTEEQLIKPNKNYSVLIDEVLTENPQGLTLKQIYKRIQMKYVYYYFLVETKGWESSVRHNLIGNEAFVKNDTLNLWFRKPGIELDAGKKRKGSSPDRVTNAFQNYDAQWKQQAPQLDAGAANGYQQQAPHAAHPGSAGNGVVPPQQGYPQSGAVNQQAAFPAQAQPLQGGVLAPNGQQGLSAPGSVSAPTSNVGMTNGSLAQGQQPMMPRPAGQMPLPAPPPQSPAPQRAASFTPGAATPTTQGSASQTPQLSNAAAPQQRGPYLAPFSQQPVPQSVSPQQRNPQPQQLQQQHLPSPQVAPAAAAAPQQPPMPGQPQQVPRNVAPAAAAAAPLAAAPVANTPLKPAVSKAMTELVRAFKVQVMRQAGTLTEFAEETAMSVVNRGIGLTTESTVPGREQLESVIYQVFQNVKKNLSASDDIDPNLLARLLKFKATFQEVISTKLGRARAEALILSAIDQVLGFTDRSMVRYTDAERNEIAAAEELILQEAEKIVKAYQQSISA